MSALEYSLTMFQFLIGTLKTLQKPFAVALVMPFQFLIGTLKTSDAAPFYLPL